MPLKCPHCDQPIDVRFIKAPPMQSQSAPTGDVGELLQQIDESLLQEAAEVDFVSQTKERYAQYGDRIRMSEKQMAWLRRIAAK